VRALLNELRGVVLAMRAIRGVNPSARLLQTEDIGRTYGRQAVRRQVAHEAHRRWLSWDLLAGRVDRGHPMRPFLAWAGASEEDLAFFTDVPCVPDVLGMNYYVTSDRWLDERLQHYPERSRGGNSIIQYADVEAVRARPEGLTGHYAHLAAAWQRYGLPLAITEVHLGCTRDEQLRWLLEAWRAAERARDDGIPVQAVTAWALLGSYDWDSLVTQDRGRYEPGLFDVRSTPPRPTALASAAARLVRGEDPAHHVVHAPGWWRRPERLACLGRTRQAAERNGAAPLLVIGARGTLGLAFQRICAVRGLPVHMVSRADVEIADASAVDAVLRRIQPWAVINAAGYVRVDAAEADTEACRRDNVDGPITLAAACRRHSLPLVTFSSDLVFDGSTARPYIESDGVAPLNAYGAAKAEAERRVLDLLPSALVVRTSAFFGPWDEYNFATQLLRSIRGRRVSPAPHDCTVSPTYVPELANAVLDLLIDGEGGIWHIANQGAVTWYEFGQAIAQRLDAPTSLIAPCGWRDVWQPARRPAYGVLGSERGLLLRPLPDAIDEYCAHMAAQFAEETTCATS
jgi:dTDP-4-dehydrorhamnose reductase